MVGASDDLETPMQHHASSRGQGMSTGASEHHEVATTADVYPNMNANSDEKKKDHRHGASNVELLPSSSAVAAPPPPSSANVHELLFDDNQCFDTEPTPLAELAHAFRRAWTSTPASERLRWAAVVVLLVGSNLVMIISFNFFLESFTYGSPGYVSNLAPAVCWAVLYLAFTAGLCVWFGERHPLWYVLPHAKKQNQQTSVDNDDDDEKDTGEGNGRRDWSLVATLTGLGAADAWGGITGTYGSPHVSIFLQTLLQGFGVIWAFLLTRLIVPARPKPQLTRWSALAFASVILATVFAVLPERDSLSTPGEVSWILVYEMAAVLPVIYNVLQGRFLRQVDRVVCVAASRTTTPPESEINQHPHDQQPRPQPNPLVVKFVMLCFDSTIQVAIILLCCFVDFLPWFGNHPGDPHGTWVGLKEGLACILGHRCPNTGWYFTVYMLSFWLSHVAGSIANHYSTTVTSFAMALYLPLTQLSLWVFPKLNVWGNHTPWPYSLTCLAFTTFGTLLFFLASLSASEKHAAARARM